MIFIDFRLGLLGYYRGRILHKGAWVVALLDIYKGIKFPWPLDPLAVKGLSEKEIFCAQVIRFVKKTGKEFCNYYIILYPIFSYKCLEIQKSVHDFLICLIFSDKVCTTFFRAVYPSVEISLLLHLPKPRSYLMITS